MFYKKSFLLGFTAFFLFFSASIYITFPLIFHLGDYATGLGDELVIAWIQAWVIHALFTQPLSLFNANIYFPYHNTLAYSDLFMTGSLLTFLPAFFIGQPIAANNALLIFSLLSLGFCLYVLTFYMTKDFYASLLSGILVIFSPATVSFSVHLQVLFVAFVPLSLLFFLIFLKNRKTRFLIFSLVCFILQVYNSFLPGYFILFSYTIIFFFYLFEKEKKVKKIISKKNVFIFLIAFILIIPIALPYLQVSHEFNYVRDIRDSIHFALQPEDLLYPGGTTRLGKLLLTDIPTNHYSQNNEFKPGYLGFVFSLLVIFSLFYLWRFRKKVGFYEKSFFCIAFLGLILSFGPFLHLNRQTIHHPFPIPLPYALFYYVLPGFQGFRNSARWEMLFIIAIAVGIGLMLSKILKKTEIRKKIGIYLVFFVFIIIEFVPIQFVSIPQKKDFPKVSFWMNSLPVGATFIEMPVYNWNTLFAQQEMLREYYNTVNFRRTVNGYTGFSPPPWQNLVTLELKEFPDSTSIKQLKANGVQYAIVHIDEYDRIYEKSFMLDKVRIASGSAIISNAKKINNLQLIKKFGYTYVYKIR